MSDLVGIAVIFPYMKIITDPDVVHSSHFLAETYNNLNFRSVQNFTIAVGVVLLLFFSIRAISAVLINRYIAKALARLTMDLTNEMYGMVMRVRYDFFLKHAASELVGTTSTYPIYSTICLQSWLNVMNELLFLGLILAASIVFMPIATIVIVAWGSLVGLLLYLLVVRKVAGYGKEQNRLENEKSRWAFATVSSIKDIKIMGLESIFLNKTIDLSGRVRDITWRYTNSIGLPRVVVESLVLVCLIGAALILIGPGSTISKVVPLMGVLGVSAIRVVPSFSRTASSYNTYKYSKEFLRKLVATHSQLKQYQHQIQHAHTSFDKSFEIQDLRFSYGERVILDGVSLTIKKGQSIGIVGLSGSGKTTMLDVIAGLQEKSAGRFLLDGSYIDPFQSDVMSSRIGYVQQHITLVDDSIAFNISFERRFDKEKLDRAIKVANLERFVAELPNGIETHVGEAGVRLSGGQRQRIGIARALYRDPEILIFDEATSALDNVTEKELTEEISRLAEEKTLIIVAHRLTTVIDCDFIHVMDHGRITRSGTHEELLRTCPLYQAMNLLSAAENSTPDPSEMPRNGKDKEFF